MQNHLEKVKRIGGMSLEIGLGVFVIAMLFFAWKAPSSQATNVKSNSPHPKAIRNAAALPQAGTLCIQDDSSKAFLAFEPGTGVYNFDSCTGLTLAGTGQVTVKGSTFTLQDFKPDHEVRAADDQSTHRANASVRFLTTGKLFTLSDRNTADDTCTCPSVP